VRCVSLVELTIETSYASAYVVEYLIICVIKKVYLPVNKNESMVIPAPARLSIVIMLLLWLVCS